MSQHFYTGEYQGVAATVLLGWDRPLGHFFMVVTVDGDEEETTIYSNLNEANAFGRDLPFFKGRLDVLCIQVPESVFSQVEKDAVNNVGNRMVWYRADGSIEREFIKP